MKGEVANSSIIIISVRFEKKQKKHKIVLLKEAI